MQVESQLLAQGIVKLAKKIKDAKYVSSISIDDRFLKVDYSDGKNQKIDLPLIKEESIKVIDNSKEIQEIKKQITCDLEENRTFLRKTHKKQSKELKKAKEELGKHFDSEIKEIATKYFDSTADNKKEYLALLTELEQKVIALIEQAISNIEIKTDKTGQTASLRTKKRSSLKLATH